jgi:SUMO ligase MMS21 Smc5/6 complex component
LRKEHEYKASVAAVAKLEEEVDAKILNHQFDVNFEAEAKKLLKKRSSNLSEIDIAKDQRTQRFERKSKLIGLSGQVGSIGASQGDDDELIMSQAEGTALDPITQRPIRDPVRNQICGHIYERLIIVGQIRSNAINKCPNIGCKNKAPLTENLLETDWELRHTIQSQSQAN